MNRHCMLGLSFAFAIALSTGCATSGSSGGGVGAPDWTEEKCWQEDQVTDILYYGVGVVRGLTSKSLARTAAKKNAVKEALKCANSPSPIRRGESEESEVAAAEGAEAEGGEEGGEEAAAEEGAAEEAAAEAATAEAEPAAEGAPAPKAVAAKEITEADVSKPEVKEEWEGSKGEMYVLVAVRKERPLE